MSYEFEVNFPTQLVPGQPGPHYDILYQKQYKNIFKLAGLYCCFSETETEILFQNSHPKYIKQLS